MPGYACKTLPNSPRSHLLQTGAAQLG